MRSFGFLLCLMAFGQVAANPSIGPDSATLAKLSEQAAQGQYHGAVVLNKTMRSVVQADGFETYTMYVAIKLLDEEGERDYSKLSSGYNAHYTERKLDFARVILNDGSRKAIENDAIQVTNVGSNISSFDDVQTLRFAVPAVKAGNIIELQTTSTQVRPMLDGHWFSQFPFHYIHTVEDRNWARLDAVLDASLTVEVDNALPVKWKVQGIIGQPKVSEQGKTTRYRWSVGSKPAVKVEANMGNFRGNLNYVKFTSVPSWKTIDDWAWAFLSEKIDSDDSLRSLAKRITADAASREQKITAIFHYVQDNVRYIGAHVGRGGYVPHNATQVLTQSYGDCKDQTVLIVALLRQLGITAFPALISPGPDSPVMQDLPLLQFSHMITYIPGQNQSALWLDTSGNTGDFPGIFGNLEGQTAFVIDGQGGNLQQVPVSQANDNRAEMHLSYLPQGDTLKHTAVLTLHGHLDTTIRNMYIAAPDKTDFIRRLMSTFVSEHPLTSFSSSDVEDWQTAFRLTMSYDNYIALPAQLAKFNYSDTMMSMVNAFTDFNYLPDPQDKVHGYSMAFPFQLVIQRDYPNIVKNGELAGTQMATELQGRYIQLNHDVEMNNQRIAGKSVLSVTAPLLTRGEYQQLFAEIAQIKQDSANYFVYANSLNAGDLEAGELSDTQAMVAHTRKLLSLGEFDKALKLSEKLVELAPASGEAYYLHGLSLGFADQLDASDAAFEKAETLGYVEGAL